MRFRLVLSAAVSSGVFATVTLAPRVVGAQESSENSERDVVDAPDGLPGLIDVGVLGIGAPRFGVVATGGYGWTEAQDGETGSHHRITSTLAVGAAPWSFLEFGWEGSFRHDIHPDDERGSDSGTIFDGGLTLRSGGGVSDSIHLGVEAGARFPGGDSFGDALANPALDFKGLVSWFPASGTTIAGHGGYRLDLTSGVGEQADRLRRGDRIALGLSDFDAVLIGAGVSQLFSKTEILGEITYDLLVGSDAPPAFESELRVGLGVRQHLNPHLHLGVLGDILINSRAPSRVTDPLVPIEPRVSARLVLGYRFAGPGIVEELPPSETTRVEEPEKVEEPGTVEEPAQPPEAEAPPVGSVKVVVVDSNKHPISDARVTLEVTDSQGQAQSLVVPLGETNVYELGDVPAGEATLVVEADLLKDYQHVVTITDGQQTEVPVELEKAATGAQLRGLVRSFSGEGITASVRVKPAGLETTCDAEGRFELDLPPGKYEVIIEAEGYRSQRRWLTVRPDGVTVLNADLRKAR